jgi:hypothetical protein
MHGREPTPVCHLHLKESSAIPSVLCGADAFTITRLESSVGLAGPITKVSTVPALLAAVPTTSLAGADLQFWVDEKRVPRVYTLAFRSTVIDLDARPSCWVKRAFGYVVFHVPRRALDEIAGDLGVDPVETYGQVFQEQE